MDEDRQMGRVEMANWIIDQFGVLARAHRDSVAELPRHWREGMRTLFSQLPRIASEGVPDGTRITE